MNTNPLDDLIGAYAKQPLPPPPVTGSADIWLAIEDRRRRSFWARVLPLLDWRELFFEPRMATAAFVLAVVVGILPGYIVVSRTNEEAQLARRSLHFEMFSGHVTDLFANPQAIAKP
jgi:hypothetical protein